MSDDATSCAPAEKDALRRALRQRIAGLDPVADRRAAQRLTERVLASEEIAAARRVFTCLSFGDEVDTWALVDRLLDTGREVVVPRTAWRSRRMTVHAYPCRLETLRFGLRQPAADEPAVDPATLDVALVLGLGFDRRGYRLGHGAGFFDRFLAGRDLPTLGLARDIQLVDPLPVEAHDVPMTAVLTESGRVEA